MIVFVAFEDEKFDLFMLCNWFIIDVMPLKSSISLFFLHRSIFIMNNLCFLFYKTLFLFVFEVPFYHPMVSVVFLLSLICVFVIHDIIVS